MSDGSWVGKKHPNLEGVKPCARDNVWPPTEQQQQRHEVAGNVARGPRECSTCGDAELFASPRSAALRLQQASAHRVVFDCDRAAHAAVHMGQAPVPASVGLETLAKKISIVRGPPVGRDKDSQTNDEDGALLLPASKMVVSGHRHRRLRHLVDHLMGDGSSNQDSLLERKAVAPWPRGGTIKTPSWPFSLSRNNTTCL